ncbi:slightly ste11-like protein [Zalaria obscura]|uniref:Slightly ste11-like protein n=1 Tax=Zalaria obscura TaxID=2024903 RepID=A0ACC3S5L9_9PEZI
MKTHVRLHAVIAFAVCTLVYLAWHLSSLQLPAVTEQIPWTRSTRRLAAFGDSWSASTRQSSVSALTSKLHLSDETRHAPSWVEVLCMEIDCDHLSNLAKDSTFLTPDGFGSVVDNKEWNRGLVEKAAAWDASTGGNIIVPEFDTWFLDQIRASQPAALGYNSQASAPGSSQVGEFTELKSPCMDHTASGGNGSGQTDAHAQTACQDASHHLFCEPQIVFTRQLWKRTMPGRDNECAEVPIGTRTDSKVNEDILISPGGKSPTLQPREARRLSRTSSQTSHTPLTPEESPPFGSARKRSASVLDEGESVETPSHTRDNSGASATSFPELCLCPPEAKVPRPRNAFILYRSHHHGNVAARHPGFSNPAISKILGEKWTNESDEEKARWKQFAENEKLAHAERYPNYRYQPKRSTRRHSISATGIPTSWEDVPRCSKCGGRTTNARGTSPSSSTLPSTETSPSSAYPTRNAVQLPPPTPSSTTTPSTRYLPMLNNLSLQSPHARRMQGHPPQYPGGPVGPPPMQQRDDDRVPPLTPDPKRRRFGSPQSYVPTRAMPPRQGAGPGTPFPFHPQGHPQGPAPGPPGRAQHPYPPVGSPRRESLPRPGELLRGQPPPPPPPGHMPPPPRPGYAQHRLSQGRVVPGPQDLSLTLPPLQTSAPPAMGSARMSAGPASGPGPVLGPNGEKLTLPEQIMAMPFLTKILMLGQVAPALPWVLAKGEKPRGVVIAVEGDDAVAARELTDWLGDFFAKDGGFEVDVLDGPKMPAPGEKDVAVQDVLQVIQQWHAKSKEIVQLVRPAPATAASGAEEKEEGNGKEAAKNTEGAAVSTTPTKAADAASTSKSDEAEKMDLDPPTPSTATTATVTAPKRILLLRTYSLTASNAYATSLSLPLRDNYHVQAHWQWTATLWRGIVGPDMTIYVKDVDPRERELTMGLRWMGGVGIAEDARVMAVKNPKVEKGEKGEGEKLGVEAGALRRLGFEIGEWVMGVGARKQGK